MRVAAATGTGKAGAIGTGKAGVMNDELRAELLERADRDQAASDGLSGCVSLFIQPAAYLWGNDRVGGRFRVGPGLHERPRFATRVGVAAGRHVSYLILAH
jgi:hypothetical protein